MKGPRCPAWTLAMTLAVMMALATAGEAPPKQQRMVADERVAAAISRGIDYLLAQGQVEPTTIPGAYANAQRAFETYALLVSGVAADHPLIRAYTGREAWLEGRLILSPHAAFDSVPGQRDLRRKAVETIRGYLEGGRPRNCVNQAQLRRND